MLYNARIMPFILAGGLLLLSGCIDGDYSFSDIDTTIGLGGSDRLNLPGDNSTKAIKLDEILNLENSDFITIDSNGDYLFSSSDDTNHSTSTSVEKIVLSGYKPTSGSVVINLASFAKGKQSLPSTIKFDNKIASFDYEFSPLSADIKYLEYLGGEGNINLSIDFPEETKQVIKKIKKLVLRFPECIDLQNVKFRGVEVNVTGNSIVFKNVETANGAIKIEAMLKGIDLAEAKSIYNSIDINYGEKVDISGNIFLQGDIEYEDIDLTSGITQIEILSELGTSDIVINNVKGRFLSSYDFQSIGETTLNNVPDFLKDKAVKVSLYNPQIDIALFNEMPIKGDIGGDIISYDENSKQLAAVNIPSFTILPGNNIISIRRIESETDANIQQVVVPNLSEVLSTIPHRIAMTNVNATTNEKEMATIELGRDYSINTTYSIKAPLAFAADAKIVYREQLDGWNNSVKKLSFMEDENGKPKGYLIAEADIDNKIPAHLDVEAYAIDINGDSISSDLISISTDKEVAASPDGKTTATTHIVLTVTPHDNSVFKTLDGIYIKVSGAATDAQGNNPIEGVTLNAHNQTLTVRNLYVSKVGKLIGNFN